MSSKKVVPPGSPYDALSYREIQAECKRRGLKAVAKKDELSRSLFVDDQSPRKKEIPKPSIPSVSSSSSSSSLKTAYPPPTPPYSDSEDEDEEEEEEEEEVEQPQQEAITKKEKTPTTSPYKSPKKTTPKRTTPATSPRYPTPIKSVPLSAQDVPRVPGWMLQLGVGLILLLIAVLVYGARPVIENQVPPTTHPKTEIESILRPVLSNYPAGDKILQTIKLHEGGKALSMFLVGPTDKGLQIVNAIAPMWPRYNIDKHLIFENSNGTVIFEDIETALKKNPETIVVINTDKIDKEDGKFLGVLLDDSIAGKDKLRVDKAVIILLGDLAKENREMDINEPSVAQTLLKSRFIDRVAQRIRNIITL